ncbi:MAG TPA: hypothetical protein VFP30_07225 [Candidatus Limnocylindria bacterium]|nr:hypothetical protein [Candidatus Limnocylindria bacterium]
MPALAWLAVAIVAGAAAYLVGWPAWQGYRSRESRDLNTERYLQWRGRADRTSTVSTREGMTGDERRRIYAGAALGVVAVIGLLAFFAGS